MPNNVNGEALVSVDPINKFISISKLFAVFTYGVSTTKLELGAARVDMNPTPERANSEAKEVAFIVK